MPIQPPQLPAVLLSVERRLSPSLESWLRTDVALDCIAVANGVSRLTSRTVRDLGSAVIEAVGLPSGRQLNRLQHAVDGLAGHIASNDSVLVDNRTQAVAG